MEPLAQELGLTIDHHCDRDDTDCAAVSGTANWWTPTRYATDVFTQLLSARTLSKTTPMTIQLISSFVGNTVSLEKLVTL